MANEQDLDELEEVESSEEEETGGSSSFSLGDVLSESDSSQEGDEENRLTEQTEQEDIEQEDIEEIEEEPTPSRVPFYKTGYAKLALVAGVSFFLVAGITSLYTGLFSGGGGNTVVLEEDVPQNQPELFDEENQDERLKKAQEEASQAKAKLALAEQRNRLSAQPTPTPTPTPNNRTPNNQTPSSPPSTGETVPSPTPVPSPPPPPPPPPSPPVTGAPVPRVFDSSVPDLIPPPPPIERDEIKKPKEDPLVTWTKMSRLGQFTTLYAASNSNSGSSSSSENILPPPQPTQIYQPIYGRSATPATPVQTVIDRPRNSSPSITLSAGTSGKGRLLSSVVWAADIDITQDTYAVQLTKELGGIPKGAIVLMRPLNVSSSGLIRFVATRIQFPDGRELSVPEGAMMLGGNGGNFLQARYVNKGEPGFLNDIFSAALSGGRQVASLINRPETSTTITNSTGSNGPGSTFSQVVSNSKPDYGAAFAEGALNRITERLDRLLQGRSNSQPYFEVGKGKELDILVLKDITL